MNILVAIPVYNEADSLPRVVHAVRRFASDVLVVDDGSTDETPRLLRELRVRSLTHPENRGYGQSLIDAFAFAGRRGFDWVITLDCDEQHEPGQIPEFLEAIRRDDADVISGSRYLAPSAADHDAPADRLRINRIVTRMIREALRLELTDSFCGFKAHRVCAMRRLELDEPGYAFPLQFWPQSAAAGLRVREIPVRRIYRDMSRTFGGTLDDPDARLAHYCEVFAREIARIAAAVRSAAPHRAGNTGCDACPCSAAND